MSNKPPAFQFYAKDWRSSPNVRRMSLKEEGLYIRLCALAWDSDSPGTITLSELEICREVGVFPSSLRQFLVKFSSSFRREGEFLVQPKLHLQYLEFVKYKENKSLAGSKGNAVRWHSDRSASASATAPASATANQSQNPRETHARAKRSNSDSNQRQNVEARSIRLSKEEECRREARVGVGPRAYRDELSKDLQFQLSQLAKVKSF